VPLFHLVMSEIDRTRESRTVPAVKGIPETGPRRSRTTKRLDRARRGRETIIPKVEYWIPVTANSRHIPTE
jgi:hypothetical protein